MAITTVEIINYRLVRPDGTVLWTCVAPDYAVVYPPTNDFSGDGNYALPPWRYEARRKGEAGWTLLGEKLTP